MSAEMAVLGCALMKEHESEILSSLAPDDFLDTELRELFSELLLYWQDRGTLDVACVSAEKRKLALDCVNFVPAISNWGNYVQAVKDEASRIRAQGIALAMAARGMDIGSMREQAERLVTALNGAAQADALDMRRGVLDFMDEMQKPVSYLRTGFDTLDKYTYIGKGDYVVIGGRPSAGKTAFSIAIAVRMAAQGKKIIYFSLETAPPKIMQRIMTAAAKLDFSKVKRHQMRDEWDKVSDVADYVSSLPIEIVPASGKTVAWIRAEAVRRNADIAVIDYMGIVADDAAGRYEKVTNISMQIHNFCQQTGITVFALSQLNRNGAGKEPGMEDLRESGQIEQDADVIILLHYRKPTGAYPGEYKVIIEKNKEGETGVVDMRFDGKHQRFYERDNREEI